MGNATSELDRLQKLQC